MLRFGGESIKNHEFAIQVMLKYFRESGLTEDQLRENDKKYNLNSMLSLVKEYFGKLYGYYGTDIVLSNRYQQSINSYIFIDHEREEFVHIDELFEVSMIAFFLVIFKWAKELDNKETYGDCFLYLLFLFNDVCILGKIPDGVAIDDLFRIVNGDVQIVNLASTCYWAVVIFNFAHEVAHSYFANTGRVFSNGRKEEYEADEIAYDILLNIITDQRKLEERERTVEEYVYLVPMMYMYFIDLFYYTDRVLYYETVSSRTHPLPQDRVNHLFTIPYRDKYIFDTKEGNYLLNGFLDAYDDYRTEILLKKRNGKLENIIRGEERNRRRTNDSDESATD